MSQPKQKFKDIIDKTFSDDGFKSDITITLTNRTLAKTAFTLVGTAIAIILINYSFNQLTR